VAGARIGRGVEHDEHRRLLRRRRTAAVNTRFPWGRTPSSAPRGVEPRVARPGGRGVRPHVIFVSGNDVDVAPPPAAALLLARPPSAAVPATPRRGTSCACLTSCTRGAPSRR